MPILLAQDGTILIAATGKLFTMNRILIFGLYAFGCICAYADTAEYLKKISDSIKIQVQMQPKEDLDFVLNVQNLKFFVLNVQNLKLDDDILFNESAFNINVEVIVSVDSIKNQKEAISVYGCGTYIPSHIEPSFVNTLKPKYLIYQPAKDFLRKLKEISGDPNIEKILCIEVTFSFFNLLKSKKIDLSKTIVRSETIRLEGEELNAWLKFARSLSPITKNTN